MDCRNFPTGLSEKPCTYVTFLLHWAVLPERPPVIFVRRVGDLFDYYIQQGNSKINFRLDGPSNEILKQEISRAEAIETQAPPFEFQELRAGELA